MYGYWYGFSEGKKQKKGKEMGYHSEGGAFLLTIVQYFDMFKINEQ
jgi:hypothetical protein